MNKAIVVPNHFGNINSVTFFLYACFLFNFFPANAVRNRLLYFSSISIQIRLCFFHRRSDKIRNTSIEWKAYNHYSVLCVLSYATTATFTLEMTRTRKYLFGYRTMLKALMRKKNKPQKFFRSNAGVCSAPQILKSNVLQF